MSVIAYKDCTKESKDWVASFRPGAGYTFSHTASRHIEETPRTARCARSRTQRMLTGRRIAANEIAKSSTFKSSESAMKWSDEPEGQPLETDIDELKPYNFIKRYWWCHIGKFSSISFSS